MFNFDEWKGKKAVMHCKTPEEAQAFCMEMHEAGLYWCTGVPYNRCNYWEKNMELTCYDFNTGEESSKEDYEEYGYTILEYSDYMNIPNEPEHTTDSAHVHLSLRKKIYIVNGYPKSGKTTFGRLLGEFVKVRHISIIDPVKEIAAQIGWTGGKTEKDRKFLSDLKDLLEEYNDFPFNMLVKNVIRFLTDDKEDVLLIDIRQPEDIKRAVAIFDAGTIYIDRENADHINSNHADAGVRDYGYDIYISNDKGMDDFRQAVMQFVEDQAH